MASANDIAEIVRLLAGFAGSDLTRTLVRIEAAVRSVTATDCIAFLEEAGARREVLSAAAEMKRPAGQINVTIHALGILLCLPHILGPDERVEYVSLGAGNTGREFDLETNVRVAELKFIRWRGGAESPSGKTRSSRIMSCWPSTQPSSGSTFIYLGRSMR